ncbi:McrC family protein [Demequina muriae]|uniref:Restriction endonuclease n=1 Tax=Demequina muriae TaxID=3051664 RepID=A0ABT8GE75_9MICO|nr:restriction endonuclease [Demequina sp. EGI L300058]MDN4479717.1 restriction endonuclease [Demequina sp. EGI L300058]
MPQTVVLDELRDDGATVRCSSDVAAALDSTGLVRVEPLIGGDYRVLPRGKVGVTRIGDLQVEVHPKDKVPLASVLFLLGYAADPWFRDENVEMGRDDDLFTAIAEALVRQVSRAVLRGVHRGYVTVDETSRTLRGRIRMGDQVRLHHGRSVPAEITYDEYSADIAENRILLSALHRVLHIPRLGDETYARASALTAVFEGVSEIEVRGPLPPYKLTRLTERYRPALTLAELVLRHQSLRLGDAYGLVGASFVASMETVYEDFVGVALQESLSRYRGRTTLQYGTRLDEPQIGVPAVTMNVDVVHEVGLKPVIVADAKYKAESMSGRFPNTDKYQMLAYCTALGVDRAWLVYAAGGAPVVRRVRNVNVEIADWSLDLAMSPIEILAQVQALADAMAERAGLARQMAATTLQTR